MAFDNQHVFVPQNLLFNDDDPIVMMEKDGVKVRCLNWADVPLNCWDLEIDAAKSEGVEAALALCLTPRGIFAQHLPAAEA